MDRILEGIREFQRYDFPEQRELYEQLASQGQKPDALFITCADSRVQPSNFTRTEPGQLFLVRNAGNIVPPYGAIGGGEIATVEYALAVLGIKNIIVCGHSQCGAMQAMLNEELPEDLPGVKAWFQYAESTRQIVRRKYGDLRGAELLKAATEENVLVQLNHLSTHPQVAMGLAAGELHVYGWYFDIATGRIEQYDQSKGAFVELDGAPVATKPMPVRVPVA